MARMTIGADPEAIRAARRRSYLQQWPVEAQMEAHAEAAAGRPEKLRAMMDDMAAVRSRLPMPEKTNGG